MDVKKSQPKTRTFSMGWIWAGAVILVVVLLILVNNSGNAVTLKKETVVVSEVKYGSLDVLIDGYGQLVSDKKQLLTAMTQATVKEIVLKPGAVVTPDSVIVRLENPLLDQQVISEKQALEQAMANLEQLKLNNQREILNESAAIAQLLSQYRTAKLTREAQEKLVKSGIVADLTYKQSQLTEQELSERLEIYRSREQQLKAVHDASVRIEEQRVKQQQGKLVVAQTQVDRLVVRAGMSGVVQTLSVELGQSLNVGQQIALIGSLSDLIALIKVPQTQAQQVQLGQKAIIDTRSDKIEGRVSRIDPVVESNTVNIEIAFDNPLPKSARPMMSIDGQIIADKLENVMYLKRPANVRPFSQGRLFKTDLEVTQAQAAVVKFGRLAGPFIEITQGAEVNNKFILSGLPANTDAYEQLIID